MWRQCLFTTGLHWAVICTCLHFSAIQSKKSSLTPKTLCGKAERKGEWKWNVFYLQGCHNSKGIRTLNPKQQSFGTIWAAMRWEGQCKTHKLLKRKQNRCKNNAYCTRYCFHLHWELWGEIGKSIGFFGALQLELTIMKQSSKGKQWGCNIKVMVINAVGNWKLWNLVSLSSDWDSPFLLLVSWYKAEQNRSHIMSDKLKNVFWPKTLEPAAAHIRAEE